jgi:hypothetical protein
MTRQHLATRGAAKVIALTGAAVGFAALASVAPVSMLGDRFSEAVWVSALKTSDAPCSTDKATLTVARLGGVNATAQSRAVAALPDATAARNAFFSNNKRHIAPGHEVVLSAADGRRFALRIAGRTPITDQAHPNENHALNVLPASAKDVITVTWGNWRYVIEVEEIKSEPVLAVQQSL